MIALSTLFGILIGLSLGLTGGGGAIFAVPLLVYGIGVSPKEAISISLAAVGATSLVGFLLRWRKQEVELRPGAIFTVAGMIGAPLGTWLANLIPDPVLLVAFAGLMLIVAFRMWQQSSAPIRVITDCPITDADSGPACQRDSAGDLILTTKCARLLLLVGVGTGVLSGLFGVGGGFVIVPALVLFSKMPIKKAVGTSLMIVALVSLVGVASHWMSGRTFSPQITLLFIAGGLVGLLAGQQLATKISGPTLQRIFVVAILLVASFVLYRSLAG